MTVVAEPAGHPSPLAHPHRRQAVEVVALVKRYPRQSVNAVDGLSFSVREAEVFGLLGPNGAGKTTTIGVLTTRVVATSGTVRVAGADVRADPMRARARLAVVSQRPNLDLALTARQNLTFHASYHGIGRSERNRRADQLLEQFGLAGRGRDRVDTFSGGQSQRLMIARALMHSPEVLFLDEPTAGLDPQARLFVWDRVRELRAAGVTVLLTTHDMDEASELADRVGIMDNGRLLAMDDPAVLTRSLPGSATIELGVRPSTDEPADGLVAALSTVDGVERVERLADPDDTLWRLRLYANSDPSRLLAPLATRLQSRSAAILDVRLGEASLEDVFVALTGRGLR
ncbi:ABC transporter ATP-binding protein [Fodinicola acaciae]|uniref:ABC transporter ATP-binding protein n=1 Tax=Fodinicola acaciae TaxID=2681555 RepID=UPI0013D42008|nr:ABC transporter ATP-binding protein [Fodinicola acaciae]